MKILALDLGKFNTMCCFFESKRVGIRSPMPLPTETPFDGP
jgi:hypothetical protein